MCIETEVNIQTQIVVKTLRTAEEVVSAMKQLRETGKREDATRLLEAWCDGTAILIENLFFLPRQALRN